MLAWGRCDPFTTPSGNDCYLRALQSCTALSSHGSSPQAVTGASTRLGFDRKPSLHVHVRSTSSAAQGSSGPSIVSRRGEGSRSSPPLEHRLAPVIDTDRAPLRAVCHERREQIGELGVPTVLPRQPLHVVPLAPGDAQTTKRTGTRISDRRVAPSRGIVRNIVSCLSLLRNLGVVNEIHKC